MHWGTSFLVHKLPTSCIPRTGGESHRDLSLFSFTQTPFLVHGNLDAQGICFFPSVSSDVPSTDSKTRRACVVGNVQLQSVAVWGVESFHGVMLMPRSESDDRGWHAGLSFLSRLLLCVLCFFCFWWWTQILTLICLLDSHILMTYRNPNSVSLKQISCSYPTPTLTESYLGLTQSLLC